MVKFIKNSLVSETKKEYLNKQQINPSTIKDKNLSNFKYNYKRILRAWIDYSIHPYY